MESRKVLNGKIIAEELNQALKEEILKFTSKYKKPKPKLATILVGCNPASKIYVKIKFNTSKKVGIKSKIFHIREMEDSSITLKKILRLINYLNNNPRYHGILLQLPLPESINEYTREIINQINPIKDVDGLHQLNQGKLFNYDETYAPCTPKGIITMLEQNNIPIEGQNVVIINRSDLVGKPLIFLLLKRNATVTVCHSKTRNLSEITKTADILIVAIGKAKFIKSNMIKKGAVIIDVGISKINGKIYGDVDFDEVYDKCSAITPCIGGIGPLTVHFLLRNTFSAYKNQIIGKTSQ